MTTLAASPAQEALKTPEATAEESPDAEEAKSEQALRFEASRSEQERRFGDAIEAYTELLKRHPEESRFWHRRGVMKFMAGDFAGSVKDFDTFLKQQPSQMPYHWQRGLSQYGAGLYQEGRAQFEAHQKVNSNDVENAVWHFLCVVKLEGADAARRALIPIEGDTRVPMAQIHDLFAGEGTEAKVLEAASDAQTPAARRKNHLCYAHLYLGLYHEGIGNEEKALKHLKLAAVDHFQPHYMGETARVFYEARKKVPAPGEPAPKTSAR